MSKIKYNISLDMHSSVSQASLAAKQGDDNRQFNITLRSGGQPYKIERGAFAVFSTTLPDGKVIEDNCTIVNDEITYDFTQNLTSQVGVLDIEIRLYGPNSNLVTSPTFILVVSPRAAKAEDIVSSDSFKVLDKLYEDTSALKTEMEEKLKNGYFNGEDVNYNLVSNALKGNKRGEVVALTDISPLEHVIGVKVYGKNLFDVSRITKTSLITNNGNGTITVHTSSDSTGTSSEKTLKKLAPYLKVGDVCTLSATTTGTTKYIYLSKCDTWLFGTSLKITQDMLDSTVIFYASGASTSAIISNIQIELGSTVTEYEPHLNPTTVTLTRYGSSEMDNPKTYTPSADGSVEVTSLYPTTTLMTDTEGVVIDVEYNRDINILTKTVPLIDRVTGIPYYLYVAGGKLLIEEREE